MTHPSAFTLDIEQHDSYLQVEYAGNPLTLEMIVKTINAVADALRSTGLRRVLLIRNAPILDSDEGRAMTAQLINSTMNEDVRFAIVDKFGNDPEITASAVAASRRAGWDLTGFNTVEEARKWLKSM